MPISHLLPDTATFSPEGVLRIAHHPVPELARIYGTPLYIFDRATIINACASYKQAFRAHYHASAACILYASKAYLSPLIARLMSEQGIGLDVVSGGELLVAQRVNFPMQDVSFHGNNNLVPRPAVLLVDEQQVEIMERRETYDDLLLRYQTF